MTLQKWEVTEAWLDTKCQLGEGPYYSKEHKHLRFLDILGCKLHIVDPSMGPESLRSIATGMAIGVTADIEGRDDVILTGAKDGITKFSLETGKHEYVTRFWSETEGPEKVKKYRSNYGAVDSAGRFWLGIMNDPKEADITNEAMLCRLDTDGSLHRMLENVIVPNGISWDEKDKTMYWTESATNDVYAFDFDAKKGDISNQRVFYHHATSDHPDGHARDVEGNIWHACYAGSKVIKISPAGELVGEISLPTRNPTCPVFVGTELFITSAQEDEPGKYPESAKYAGAVFRVDVGVEGMPTHAARVP